MSLPWDLLSITLTIINFSIFNKHYGAFTVPVKNIGLSLSIQMTCATCVFSKGKQRAPQALMKDHAKE